MSGFLLDTNVVSELTRPEPDFHVIAFLTGQDDLWLSTIVLHELDFGLSLLPTGRRRERLQETLTAFITGYGDHILPLGRAEAEWASRLRARAHHSGKVLHLGDALIAGTARSHDLSIATRNVRDFDGLGVDIANPWEPPSPPDQVRGRL